jgi:hypothetical protein
VTGWTLTVWLSLWLRVGSHTGVAPLWLLFHRGRALEPVIHPNIVVRKWARNIDTCQLAVRECTLDSGVFGCARTATYVRAVMHALSSFPNERPIGWNWLVQNLTLDGVIYSKKPNTAAACYCQSA